MLTRYTLLVLLSLTLLFSGSRTEAQELPFGAQETNVNAMVEDIAPQVARLRGVEWKSPVQAGIYTREQLRQLMLGEAEKMQDELGRESLLLHQLGLVEKGFDLHEAMVDLYGLGVAGFYDPNVKVLNLIQNQGGKKPLLMMLEDLVMRFQLGVSQEEMIMAHELTHALDDQYFDLMNIIDRQHITSDMEFVRLAVTEGTAVSVQYDFLFKKTGLKSYENRLIRGQLLNDVPGTEVIPGGDKLTIPRFVTRQVLFPYTVGNRLVFEARKRDGGSWERVNRMFEDLPASTEQVLHPEKYLDFPRDMPMTIEVPSNIADKFGDGWVELHRDTFGEFKMWMYFEDLFAGRRSTKAVVHATTSGWDGDTLVMVMSPNQEKTGMLWATTWDTEDDAKEFYRLYKSVLRKKYPNEAKFSAEEASTFMFRDKGLGINVVKQEGKDVVVLEGAPFQGWQDLMATTLDSRKVEWVRPMRGAQRPETSFQHEPQDIESPNLKDGAYQGVVKLDLDSSFYVSHESSNRVAFYSPGADTVSTGIEIRILDDLTEVEFTKLYFETVLNNQDWQLENGIQSFSEKKFTLNLVRNGSERTIEGQFARKDGKVYLVLVIKGSHSTHSAAKVLHQITA